MSAAISGSTGMPYGIERVCTAWNFPRSTFYAQVTRRDGPTIVLDRRGPKPKISDEQLLEHIKNDLASTPFIGEGHRKVWARLRVRDTVRVARKRVLRVMRENHLLSPHRGRKGAADPHDGVIVTDAPNVMWGTDGARVFTVDQGWVWIFTAVEHWNAECVGWHVVKEGDRYAALEPIAMGLTRIYGGTNAGVARGLKLRMDHGTQYLADHFLNQVRYWGIAPSFAFVEQPQTNGVAERFNRTMKEQAIHGRVFKNVHEVRAAVAAFVERYNAEWLVEKLDFLSPTAAREQQALRAAA